MRERQKRVNFGSRGGRIQQAGRRELEHKVIGAQRARRLTHRGHSVGTGDKSCKDSGGRIHSNTIELRAHRRGLQYLCKLIDVYSAGWLHPDQKPVAARVEFDQGTATIHAVKRRDQLRK